MTFGFHREQWSELPPLLLSPSILVGILYYHPVYIYERYTLVYIYIYILLSFFHILAQHCVRCVETRRAGTSCPTNWDLSLLPSRDGSYAISLHAHSRVTKKCASHLYVYIYACSLARSVRHLPFPAFFFFFFFLSLPSSSLIFLPDRLKAPTLRPFYVFLLAFCSGSPRDRKSSCAVDVLLSTENFL